MNPAHGPNKEGCCIETDFGKNRIFFLKKISFFKVVAPITFHPPRVRTTRVVAASSPSLVKTSKQRQHSLLLNFLGCCPDDFTTARGPNKEGCGCYSTENGCCPDKFTPSPGPDGKVKNWGLPS